MPPIPPKPTSRPALFNDLEVLTTTVILFAFIVLFVAIIFRKFICRDDNDDDVRSENYDAHDISHATAKISARSGSKDWERETASLREYDFGHYPQHPPDKLLKSALKQSDVPRDWSGGGGGGGDDRALSSSSSSSSARRLHRPKKRVSLNVKDLESQSCDTSTISESVGSTESPSLASHPRRGILGAKSTIAGAAASTDVAASAGASATVLPSPLSPPSYSSAPPVTPITLPRPYTTSAASTTAIDPPQPPPKHTHKDPRLVRTLLTVLEHGMQISKYGHAGPKPVLLTLTGGELSWKTNGKLFPKSGKKLPLSEITLVNWGKQTNTFHLQSARGAAEDHCFSLITAASDSLDFECTSRVERDALAQGFAILVARHGQAAPTEHKL